MIIDPASVAFDIDGVVADTMNLFIDIARQEFDVNGLRYKDITCYNLADCLNIEPKIIDAIVTRILDGNYTVPLRPLAGSPEVLVKIERYCGTLTFITARPYLGPMPEWIGQTLQLAPDAFEIIATGSHEAKAGILKKRRISFFVEDRLETCFVLRAAGVRPVLFKQPWNRESHPFKEVDSWDELHALIKF